MEDFESVVQASRPGEGGAGREAPCARLVSPEAFMRAVSVAWGHLKPPARKAIRATCRSGRLQHDSLLTELHIVLGEGGPRKKGATKAARQQQQQEQQQQSEPTSQELRISLQAVLGRGARLQALKVRFQDGQDDGRQAQLLTVLEACSGCPVTKLVLEGAVPVSSVVAEAVQARCPQLSTLHLAHRTLNRRADAPPQGQAATEYEYGCVQLLTLCGPRLAELRLLGVQHWMALPYMALRRCTALTTLAVDAGLYEQFLGNTEPYLESPALEAHVYGEVAQLTQLQKLHLYTNFNPDAWPLDAIRAHATAVASLSTLTGLTSLDLSPSWCYENHGDSWSGLRALGDQRGAWCAVREAHRSSLLSAVRCMPQLQLLECPALWLQPCELASMTALTSIRAAGLLPPAVAQHPIQLLSAGGGPPGSFPPQLRVLQLRVGSSPRALAALQPPASFTTLRCPTLRFGMSDVRGVEGRLLPEVVAAVGPAVRLLVAYRAGGTCIGIEADGGAFLLLPREDAPNGHIEWIQQLQGLDAFRRIELEAINFRPGELSCLGHTLCRVTALELQGCAFPVAALPLLRNPMLQLRDLKLDVVNQDGLEAATRGLEAATLESVLLLLCRPHSGVAPLASLTVNGCSEDVEAGECEESVRMQLELDFGVTGVELCVE